MDWLGGSDTFNGGLLWILRELNKLATHHEDTPVSLEKLILEINTKPFRDYKLFEMDYWDQLDYILTTGGTYANMRQVEITIQNPGENDIVEKCMKLMTTRMPRLTARGILTIQ